MRKGETSKRLIVTDEFFFFYLFSDRVSLGSSGWPQTHFLLQVDLNLTAILLLQSPECWDYRGALPHPASLMNFYIWAYLEEKMN